MGRAARGHAAADGAGWDDIRVRLVSIARRLRRRQTDAERNLWARLKSKQIEGVKFRRQQPLGPYVVDFVCLEKKLVVEIDGGQHNEDDVSLEDSDRAAWLVGEGYRVLRFWNNDVMNQMESVLEKIREELLKSPSS